MEQHLNLLFGIMNLFTASLVTLVCFPLLNRSVKMNNSYGFRFKQAYQSEEAWYKINRHGAIHMILWSVVLMAISVFFFFVPIRVGSSLYWFALGAPVLLLLPAYQSHRFAKNYSQSENTNPTDT